MEKRSTIAAVTGRLTLHQELADEIADFDEAAEDFDRSATEFLLNHGTHVVERCVTGDAIYQVLVYQTAEFDQIRQRMAKFDVANATRAHFAHLLPTPPIHAGKLQVPSAVVINSPGGGYSSALLYGSVEISL